MPDDFEAVATLIAAVLFTVVAVAAFIHLFLSVRRWPRATGTVQGNVSQARSFEGNHYAFFPVIAFKAADGKTYEFRGDIGLNHEWPPGQQVDLRYRAGNPAHATMMKGWQRLLFAAVFAAFAAGCWYAWFSIF
jgi:hypothetical protein